jgi:hypothetical protein
MARFAKTTKTTKPAVRGRKPGRPASVAAKTPVKVTKPAVAPKRAAMVAPNSTGRKAGPPAVAAVSAKALTKVTKVAAAPKRIPVAATPTLKLSRDELRVQLEKLERANATLRAKNREANRTAKAATARISELEVIVAKLEHKAAPAAPATPAKVEKAAAKPTRVKRQSGKGGRGAAVPPGVATQEPAPHDDEAETAQESLEEQLRDN